MKKTNKGFTLVEAVMSIIILAIIATVAVHPLMQFYNLWQISTYRMELLWDSRIVMEELGRNIRMVGGVNNVTAATASRFTFVTSTGVNVDYQFTGGALKKTNAVFMRDVNSCLFTYYDSTGAAVTPVFNPTNIRSVVVALTMANSGQSVSSTFRIKCRNLN